MVGEVDEGMIVPVYVELLQEGLSNGWKVGSSMLMSLPMKKND